MRRRRGKGKHTPKLQCRGTGEKAKSYFKTNCMEEQEDKGNKRKLCIDWKEVLPESNDEPPEELIVTKAEPPTTAQKSGSMSALDDDSGSGEEYERKIPDHELGVRIGRMKSFYENGRQNLPDRGKKFIASLQRLEKERERRRLRRTDMVCLDVDGCDKLTQSMTSDASDCFRQRTTSPQAPSKSSFADGFSEKMEENRDCRVEKACDKELSILAHCDHWKLRSDSELSQKGRPKDQSSSRKWPFHRGDKPVFSNGFQKYRDSSTYPSHHSEENLSSSFRKKKDVFQVLPSDNKRHGKGQTLVLLDEDESSIEETTEETEETEETLHVGTTEQADELAECMKDAKIYYPSRDDPESVEICYMDINHLAPAAYLTSTIMNFYIRYLQQQASPTNRAMRDYHFFNTYFYSKLKDAVSHKGSAKDSFFMKFRRWWKGVNIFQKSYVFIPIHEDLHWSLVIICIPDKEDESGPIILHLDSLGLHCSQSVFNNIRRYLKEEWNCLEQEVSPSDLPIADRIWQNLPRRIDEKIIAVPQQKNDYDCGLFVLFFMERFIEDAPERLKKKDLAMFGKRWFKPEEASRLRIKIRNLLKKEFELASDGCCISKCSSSPGGAQP